MELAQRLKEKFDGKISVRYIDTEKTGFKKYFTVARAIQMGYNFPIVVINGHPRFAGGIDLEKIQDFIKDTIDEN
ncbi:MAG: hypothetical protein ABFC94_08945 [Syntrophomonas sp.]